MKYIIWILLVMQVMFAEGIESINTGEKISGSVEKLEKKYYKVLVPNRKHISVKLTNLKNDVDLYVKSKGKPRIRSNDCYSSNSNMTNEECSYQVFGPAPGIYDNEVYILVYGFKTSSYTLEVTIKDKTDVVKIKKDTPIQSKVKKGESKHYVVSGLSGQTALVTLTELSADADLRTKVDRKASRRVFDCKSTNSGTKNDTCQIKFDKDSKIFIEVYGYRSTKYTLTVKNLSSTVDEKLIKKAKEHCLNKDESIGAILCSNERNRVYILEKEFLGYEVNYRYYNINITPNKEKVTFIKKYSFHGNGAVRVYLKKLENTPLFLMWYVDPSADSSGGVSVYYRTKKLLQFHYYEQDNIIKKIKSIDNGKKLEVELSLGNYGENPSHVLRTYDISTLDTAKLVLEENL